MVLGNARGQIAQMFVCEMDSPETRSQLVFVEYSLLRRGKRLPFFFCNGLIKFLSKNTIESGSFDL